MRRYDTSIKALMQAKGEFEQSRGEVPIFLSDWDSDINSICMPTFDFDNTHLEDVQKYYFWTDEEGYRSYIKSFFQLRFLQSISKESFTIGSNGTASIMLTLTALKEAGKQRALVITPVYFSTLNLLDGLDFEVVEYRLSANDNFTIHVDVLENLIANKGVDVLIITNPLFGTGVEINPECIKDISQICNRHNVCLVMDYIYGGMSWNIENPTYYIFNFPVYEAVKISEQHVFIESISKRIFLNGAKFALVFASPSIMRRILRLSVFMVGSMSQQQVNLIPQVYSQDTEQSLIELISENAQMACRRYRLIKTILTDSQCTVSNANCGYFALVSMPSKSIHDDISYAIKMLKSTGILTTPHSRYLYKETGRYAFRINLLLDQNKLIEGITRLGSLE